MSSTKSLRLAVFDCDGTLVDSLGNIVATVTLAWKALDLPPPEPAAVRRYVGLPLEEAIARLAPDMDSRGHSRLRDAYRDAYFNETMHLGAEGTLYPGLHEVIESLEAAGWLLGIATGKGREGLERTLEHHGLSARFVTLQTADVAPGKPDPSMLLRAMADTGANPETTVMIGDTSYDMQMARNARVAAVGVSWGYHEAGELRAAGAAVVVDEADSLPSTLDELTTG